MARKKSLEELEEIAKSRIRAKLDWSERLVSKNPSNGKVPFPAQFIRAYEAIENGTKRILFADATGFGKTYVVSMILGLLNEEKNRRHKALLIAPDQSIKTAWTESEINGYIDGLGLQNGKPLRIAQLRKDNLDGILRGNDIVCTTYHKFNCASSDKYVDAMLSIADKIDIVVIDEGQNDRSFKKRGYNMEKLIQKTKNKRGLWLSATPGYNGPECLSMPFHFLDPVNVKYGYKYDFNEYPEAVRDLIIARQWFNSDRETVKQLHNLPDLVMNDPVWCDIGSYYGNKYLNVWKDGDLEVGSKIAQLRKYSLLGKIRSEEGRKDLENLLERIERDQAVSIFTHLRTGVSGPLFEFLERFYGKGKVGMINGAEINGRRASGDGDKKVRERVEVAKRFSDGEYSVLMASLLTMGEGIPLVTGDRPLSMIFAEIPQNHGQLDQAIGRGYRPGQNALVNVYYLLGKSDLVSDGMIKIKESGELEKLYNATFGRNWRASLIDQDIYEVLLKKEETDKKYIRRGVQLDDYRQDVMRFDESTFSGRKVASRVLRSLTVSNKKNESPWSLFTRTNFPMVGCGEEEMVKASKGKGKLKTLSRYMVEGHFDERFLDSAAGDTARLIRQGVDGLEESGVVLEDLLDLGCGTGVVSQVLGRKMVNLDLDGRMLRDYRGKKGFWIGPKVQGLMGALPFDDGSFDLVTASYSLFYNRQQDNSREIEKELMEANRVLRDGGHFIASLVRSTNKEDTKKIGRSMQNYGFKLVENDFYNGYKISGRRSNFAGAYILSGKKIKSYDGYKGRIYSVYGDKYHNSRGQRRLIFDGPKRGSSGNPKVFKINRSNQFKNSNGLTLGQVLGGGV